MEFKIVVNKSEHDMIVALLRVNGVKFAKGPMSERKSR